MSKPIVFDGETHREMTTTEFEAWQQLNNEIAERKTVEQNKIEQREAAKQSARSKLTSLGLTAAEIDAFLGA